MILLIDSYDSFSYNLYQMIGAIEPDTISACLTVTAWTPDGETILKTFIREIQP